jgi:16S rRNA (adenine1518-N6/adenine1519-N6)-dimethyltransferase
MTKAKKRFGQNFLNDPHKAQRLVDSLDISPGDFILEVGPGDGALTTRILEKKANLTAVELDRDLIPGLKERFDGTGRFRLIEDDIVRVNPNLIFSGKIKLIGNLPYNISGAMLEWMIKYSNSLHLAVITVQKEVADRLRSEPNKRNYGSLSVMAQTFFDIKRLFDIPPGCFKPKPKVMSTALELKPNHRIKENIPLDSYIDFLRACFFKKRKKLINSLVSVTGYEKDIINDKLSAFGYGENIRAEQLSVEEFINLFYSIKNDE